MPNEFCTTCGACGCGVTLYTVYGKPYCAQCRPVITISNPLDPQVLTIQQTMNLINGQ